MAWLLAAVVACARPASIVELGSSREPTSEPPVAGIPTPTSSRVESGVELERLLGRVDRQRLRRTVLDLVAFETRHTASSVDDPARGIGAARTYLERRLEALGGELEVSVERFELQPDGDEILAPVEVHNVIAVLPGRMPQARARHYYLVAHYDSRASDGADGRTPAPGANDNASGVAVVLEVARLLAERPQDATIVFLLTGAEEQGLYGARHHARLAAERGVDVRAVLNNDVVGDPSSPIGAPIRGQVRVFASARPYLDADPRAVLERGGIDDGPSRRLARVVLEVAAAHEAALPVQPRLVLRDDRLMRGGDHLAFIEQGFAAIRLTEVEESFHRQHQDPRIEAGVRHGDDPEALDWNYLAGVTRLDLTVVVHLASAPSAPPSVRLVPEVSPTTTLEWEACPEPDVEAYEVVWRSTDRFEWEGSVDVGSERHVTLLRNKDNSIFGVRARDLEGRRGPATIAR